MDDLILLTVADVAEILRCSKNFVTSLVRAGKIPVVQIGVETSTNLRSRGQKNFRFRRCDVEAFIDAKTTRVVLPSPTVKRPDSERKLPIPSSAAMKSIWDGVIRGSKPRAKKSS